MDVAADDGVRVVEHGLHAVGENDLRLSARLLDDALVVVDIVHTREGVDDLAKGGAEARQIEHVVPRVDPGLVELVERDKVVADLVGRIAQHEHELLHARGDAREQEGEAVAAEDGERHAHHVAAGLGTHVGGNLLGRGVVALAAGHDGLRHSDDILVARLDAVFMQGGQHRFRDAGDNIVTLAENGGAHASDHGSNRSVHVV